MICLCPRSLSYKTLVLLLDPLLLLHPLSFPRLNERTDHFVRQLSLFVYIHHEMHQRRMTKRSSTLGLSLSYRWKEGCHIFCWLTHLCVATPLTPSECRKTLSKSRLDVRNGYEWDIGHFHGAQRPNVFDIQARQLKAHFGTPIGV
ncbi:putative Rhodanese-like domain superfamily protein [Helianthus annuus]|nr:putative Rhodanese-like domain superfamily protein [Helianthus annuus]